MDVATLLESEVPYGHRKSSDRAAQLKEKGNSYFSKSQPADTLRAMRLYTEVLTKLSGAQTNMGHSPIWVHKPIWVTLYAGHLLRPVARGRAEASNVSCR